MANQQIAYTFTAKDRFSGIARKIKAQAASISNRFKTMGKSIERAGGKLKKFGKSAQKISLGATLAVGGSLKAFGDLEVGVTNVLTLLDKAEFDKFGGTIQAAAASAVEMGFSIDDSTKALFDNVSALGANDRSFKAFKQGQKLAIAGVTDLSIAGDGITSVTNAYASELLEAGDVANAFFAAQKRGKTTVAELASTVGTVAPFASKAGIGFDTLLATMAQVTLGGVSTAETATALKGVITALMKPTTEAAKILGHYGVATNVVELKQQGLVETLRKLNILNKEHPELLTKAIPNIRAFLGAASLTDAALDNILKTTKEMKSTEAFGDAHLKQMATFNFAIKQLFGNVKIAAAQIGAILAPAVLFLARGVGWAVAKFKGLSQAMKTWVAFLLAGAAMLSGVATTVGFILIILGKGALVAGAIAATFAAAPLAIAAGVLALGTAIVGVIANLDFLKEKAAAAWGWVKSLVGLGEEGEMNIKATGETTNKGQLDVNIGLNDPGRMVKSVKTKTTGTIVGLNKGVSMAGAQ